MNEWLTSKRTRPMCLRRTNELDLGEIDRKTIYKRIRISKEKRQYNDRGQSMDGSENSRHIVQLPFITLRIERNERKEIDAVIRQDMKI